MSNSRACGSGGGASDSDSDSENELDVAIEEAIDRLLWQRQRRQQAAVPQPIKPAVGQKKSYFASRQLPQPNNLSHAPPPLPMDFKSTDAALWSETLLSYDSVIKSLAKPDLISHDNFYRKDLPALLHQRDPNPYITTAELSSLMEWKLARGKWRPRLLSFVSSLADAVVTDASTKAFAALPDVSKAVSALTVLKGVGPATASAVLAAYAPDVAPFMSDEAMVAVLGNSKDYSLKTYVSFVEKVQAKAKELSCSDDVFTPSDVERALWSCSAGAKVRSSSKKADEVEPERKSKRKRK